jgi:hypothetical protein
MAIGEAEYFEQRLDDQINGYDRKSSTNQTSYKRLRLIEIVAAASIPLLAGFAQGPWYIGVSIGVVGLIVAVLAGVVSLYRFQENWNDYRASAESLKQEKYLYLARAEPYNGDHGATRRGVAQERNDGLGTGDASCRRGGEGRTRARKRPDAVTPRRVRVLR